ncbi:hypothetical protein EV715DRAFT_261702 [Schizophyllum commune]
MEVVVYRFTARRYSCIEDGKVAEKRGHPFGMALNGQSWFESACVTSTVTPGFPPARAPFALDWSTAHTQIRDEHSPRHRIHVCPVLADSAFPLAATAKLTPASSTYIPPIRGREHAPGGRELRQKQENLELGDLLRVYVDLKNYWTRRTLALQSDNEALKREACARDKTVQSLMEQNLTLAAKLERYEGRTWARLSDFCLVIYYGLAAIFLASFFFGLLLAEVLFDVLMSP